jgi:hypothetical protein
MRRIVMAGFVLLVLSIAPTVHGQVASRPVRVGNTNLISFGIGYPSFDHPNFTDDVYWSLMYQHRILRREVRQFPLWVRGGITFMEEDRKYYGYTVWRPDDDVPFEEEVSEHTSDFTVRFEALVDALHGRTWAIYGGAGLAIHALTFNSDGNRSEIPQFEQSKNALAPSLAAGARLFMAEKAATLYGEVRYGRVYGRVDPTGTPWLTEQTFDFDSVDGLFLEGGLGLHW